jgi:CHASE1-domain containing sensor protein
LGELKTVETQRGKQQTMSEFLTQSKSYRVWLIIMAALLSLIIIGMAYEIQQTQKRTRSV